MRRSLGCSLLVLASACPRPPAVEHAGASPEWVTRCFEIVDHHGPSGCNVYAETWLAGCFDEEGVELSYNYDLAECEAGEDARLEPRRDHGDLAWRGHLGPSWAADVHRALAGPRALDEQGIRIRVTLDDGTGWTWRSHELEVWRPLLFELDDIAAETAGLGAPAPIVVIARGRLNERFELRPRPAEHATELSWTGDRSGRCTVDLDLTRDTRASVRANTLGRWAQTCPTGPVFALPRFGLRGDTVVGCSFWTGEGQTAGDGHRRVDLNLGEVSASITATLEALRAAVATCSAWPRGGVLAGEEPR